MNWYCIQTAWSNDWTEKLWERVLSGPYSSKENAEKDRSHWSKNLRRNRERNVNYTYGVEQHDEL